MLTFHLLQSPCRKSFHVDRYVGKSRVNRTLTTRKVHHNLRYKLLINFSAVLVYNQIKRHGKIYSRKRTTFHDLHFSLNRRDATEHSTPTYMKTLITLTSIWTIFRNKFSARPIKNNEGRDNRKIGSL